MTFPNKQFLYFTANTSQRFSLWNQIFKAQFQKYALIDGMKVFDVIRVVFLQCLEYYKSWKEYSNRTNENYTSFN